MIKMLQDITDTVSYDISQTVMLYDNHEEEEYPFHWHTPVEIIMPLENDYHVELNTNIHYNLNEEDILLLRPGVLHKLYAQEGHRIIFQISFNILSSIDNFEGIFEGTSQAKLITPATNPDIHRTCVNLLKEIREEYLSNAPLKDASVYSKALNMLVLIRRNASESSEAFTSATQNKQKEYMEKFANITEYLRAHCNEDISLEEISERSGFSKFHFSRLFKEFTGVSYYKYVNQKRIEYAERLLINPETSITEVATMSGFNSISSFIRMFKQIKNCTPTEYRNLYRTRKILNKDND